MAKSNVINVIGSCVQQFLPSINEVNIDNEIVNNNKQYSIYIFLFDTNSTTMKTKTDTINDNPLSTIVTILIANELFSSGIKKNLPIL
jgi:hypothetical protein